MSNLLCDGGETFALRNYIYGKDTIQYEWGYTDDPKDDRNNTFITVGDKAEILKQWFPKLDMEHSEINQAFGNPIPKFNGVQFDFVGVRDKKTGKWLSGGYIWVHCKKDRTGQWVISKIETYNFEGDAQPID